jgi:pantoate--beta-alanine ligase
MKVIKEISAMQNIAEYYRRIGSKIGFVPTMGFLHEGHLSLILKARDENDIVITSIFVNPTQFLPNEDFGNYPRDFLRDYHLCKSCGCDYIFYPESKDMFPDNYLTYVNVNKMSDKLEGMYRPGHFKGVVTVVLKLLNIVKPHSFYLGQKDAQQAAILRKMIDDLRIDAKLNVCETIREENGLAMSSRNTYLSEKERNEASILYEILNTGKKLILEKNIGDTVVIKNEMKKILETKSPRSSLQYIAITDNTLMEDIKDLKNYSGEVLISLAAFFGKTRLIDNILLKK